MRKSLEEPPMTAEEAESFLMEMQTLNTRNAHREQDQRVRDRQMDRASKFATCANLIRRQASDLAAIEKALKERRRVEWIEKWSGWCTPTGFTDFKKHPTLADACRAATGDSNAH